MKSSSSQIAFAFFFFNLLLKVIFIQYWDIALDEPFTIFYAQQNLDEIFNMLYSENNPPLHFILLHFIIKFFGIGSFAMRLPSVLFSSLTAVFIFRIGNDFFKKNVGIIAALLFTFSTMHVFFSHEARVYPLFCLLTSSSIFYFLGIYKQANSTSNYVGLFVSNLLLIYAHYFGFFVLITEAVLYLFLFKNKGETIKQITFVVVALVLSYLPIINIFINRATYSAESGTWVTAPKITELYGNINRFLNDRMVTAALVLVVVLCVIILWKNRLQQLKSIIQKATKNSYIRLVVVFFALPYFSMFLLSYKAPMFIDRYILFTSVPLMICIAILLETLSNQSKLYYAFVSIIFIVQILYYNLKPDNNRRIKEVAETVNAKKENAVKEHQSIKIFITPSYADLSFAYHYNQAIFQDYQHFHQRLISEEIYSINNTEQLKEALDTKTQQILLIEAGSEFIDPSKSVFNHLNNTYKLESSKDIFEIYKIYSFNNK